MGPIRRIVVALGCASMLGASVGVAMVRGTPSNDATLTYVFTDCVGPAGMPASFVAVKQPGGAAALHMSDGSGTFVVTGAVDLATGATLFATPGFDHNGLPTITCTSINPVTTDVARVTGFIAPIKGR